MYLTRLKFILKNPIHLGYYVLISTFPASCRAPDFTTRVLYKCPCGDQPVQIPEYRQRQTYRDGAYWCSTVMAMLVTMARVARGVERTL